MKTLPNQIAEWCVSQNLLSEELCPQVIEQLASAEALTSSLFEQTRYLHGLTRTFKPLTERASLILCVFNQGIDCKSLSPAQRKLLLQSQTDDLNAFQKLVLRKALGLVRRIPRIKTIPRASDTSNQIRYHIALRTAICAGIASNLVRHSPQDKVGVSVVDEPTHISIVLPTSETKTSLRRLLSQYLRLWNQFAPRPIRVAFVASNIEQLPKPVMDSTVNQTARSILRYHTEHILSLQYGLLCLDDIEYIHEMRVAVRRLRCTLRVFRKAFTVSLDGFKSALDLIGQTLGKTRDKDVFNSFLSTLTRMQTALPASSLQAFLTWGIKTRRRDQNALRKPSLLNCFQQIRCLWYPVLTAQTLALQQIQTTQWGSRLTRDTTPGILGRRLQRVLRFDRPLKDYSSDQLHRLRIACKRLRYTSEFLSCFYKSGLREIIEPMNLMQDLLGEARDLEEHIQRLQDLLDESQDESLEKTHTDAVSYLQRTLSERREEVLEKAAQTWNRIRRSDSVRAIKRLIAQTKSDK